MTGAGTLFISSHCSLIFYTNWVSATKWWMLYSDWHIKRPYVITVRTFLVLLLLKSYLAYYNVFVLRVKLCKCGYKSGMTLLLLTKPSVWPLLIFPPLRDCLANGYLSDTDLCAECPPLPHRKGLVNVYQALKKRKINHSCQIVQCFRVEKWCVIFTFGIIAGLLKVQPQTASDFFFWFRFKKYRWWWWWPLTKNAFLTSFNCN